MRKKYNLKFCKELTILRKVIPMLSSGSKPTSENSVTSCFLEVEADIPGSEEEEGFRVSMWKSWEKPLNGFFTGMKTIFLGKGVMPLVEGSIWFGGWISINETSTIGAVQKLLFRRAKTETKKKKRSCTGVSAYGDKSNSSCLYLLNPTIQHCGAFFLFIF